jgi:hypothetical protein
VTTAPTAPTTTTTTKPAKTTTSTKPAVPPKPPKPGAGPPPPPGVSASSGYASYDDCKGRCSGSVPASLFRPLKIPPIGKGGICPTSRTSFTSYAGAVVGSGPVYASQANPLALTTFVSSPWDGARVRWVASPRYRGPILIRGRQISGPSAVGFGDGHTPEDDLQLLDAATKSSHEPAGAREWPSFTRVPAAGCFAYQVDGTNFSEVIVFLASERAAGRTGSGNPAGGHNRHGGHSFGPTRTSPRSQRHTSRRSGGA